MRVNKGSERASLRLNMKKAKIIASGPNYCMASRRRKGGSSDRFPLLGLQNHCRRWLQPWNQKTIASWQGSDNKPRQRVAKQRCYSADKGPYRQGYGLPCGHVWLWELYYKEGRMLKNWCLQTVVPKKTPESPLHNKEIKPVNLKGNQPWMFTGRTDAEPETPVFWSSNSNSQLIGKVPDLGKDWGQKKKKRASEGEMAGWHHRCNEHELGQTLGNTEGQVNNREGTQPHPSAENWIKFY